MAGGKKARGYAAKQKQHQNASPPIERNTAFITTPGGRERVFPPEVRNTIYRYLLLGRNVKKQRESELWNSKGWADFYDFEVNILRVNKAVYAEGKRRTLHSNFTPSTLLTCAVTWNSKKSPLWEEHLHCLVDQGARNLLPFQASRHSSCL